MSNKCFKLVGFLILLFTTLGAANGQRIKYTAKGRMISGKEGNVKYTKLIDDVVFTQGNTTVYCDSATFFKKDNRMEAYSNVRIEDGDSVTITGDVLTYEGEERKAKLRSNVIYTSGTKKLYTDILDYNLETKVASFYDGGKLVDEQNTLTSKTGLYLGAIEQAEFYTDVELKGQTFDMETDTLIYNTVSKVAKTKGYTHILTNKGEEITSEGGEYRTVRDQIDLSEGHVETIDYFLKGDELYYDDFREYHRAIGRVSLTAKNQDVFISGDEGYYNKKEGFSKIYGNPVMKRVMERDTFYLSADTLVAIESDYDSLKRILAYKDVKIFKYNLQGISDSISYFLSDSLIFMYDDPVLWTKGNQIEADTVSLTIKEKRLEQMDLFRNSFLVSTDTLLQYNQVKGRNMIAKFDGSMLKSIEVSGNGESLYYALTPDNSALLAINRILCSNMMIRFKENNLANISFYKQPEAKTIPPHELNEEDRILDGFKWRAEEKPTLFDVIRQQQIQTTKSVELPVNLEKPALPDKIIIKKEQLIEKSLEKKEE